MAGNGGASTIAYVNHLIAGIVGIVSGIPDPIKTLRKRHRLAGDIRYFGVAQQMC
jgi:hypothetical protein